MTIVRPILGGLLAAAAVVAFGCSVAWAQEGGQAAPARGTNITIEKREYDIGRLTSAPAVPDDVYRGRAVWLQRCAYCHDGVGQPSYQTMGPWLGGETVQNYSEDGVKAIIAAGTERMPGFQYALKPAQVNDLIAFLKTRGSDTKPTPDQLAGRAPGGAPVSGD